MNPNSTYHNKYTIYVSAYIPVCFQQTITVEGKY